MHIILQLCYKILRSCEEIATIRTTVRFFLLKFLRNSLKYFLNHTIFYSFSFEFLLITMHFLLNKFSFIKTSSKTAFLINTASNLLHNSMPPLHRKRSPSPQGEAFQDKTTFVRLHLRGAGGVAVWGVAPYIFQHQKTPTEVGVFKLINTKFVNHTYQVRFWY